MIEYVLGFAFTPMGKVALIRKKRPKWQNNCWNGVGGHREGAEWGGEAMAREFLEETGVSIRSDMWRLAGRMFCEDHWRVLVYTVTADDVVNVKTMTDEEVMLMDENDIHIRGYNHYFVENVLSLIELCKLRANHAGTIPLFTLDYSKDR